ncbi:MAG: OmpA family protein [Sandaracinus sp.]|nr:OmpA family protein [Sandaracinus sp.]MCB9613563.1 OmpA family protein [Sandaracinus sp.]
MSRLVAALACLFLLSSSARAQDVSDQFDTQLFHPTVGPGATFTLDRPTVPRHGTFSVGLAANLGTGTFRRAEDDEDIVPWRFDAELLASVGLFEWIELGLAMPVVIASTTNDPFASDLQHQTTARPGDLRLQAKVPILRGDLGLAARAIFSLPTGDGSQFLGTDYWTMQPSLVLGWKSGIFTLSADVGWRFRRRVVVGAFEWDDELFTGLGGALQVHEKVAIIAEAQARFGLAGRSFGTDEIPAEADLGARVQLARGLTVDVGGGTALSSGWGSPRLRAFVILRYASEREPCAAGPEDYDGYEDGDFCADPDNDADGLEDTVDECPNDAEDVDGFLDADGCPDVDDDADGILDAQDTCPRQSEDVDGFQDDDGCPDLDNDEDGIPDGVDRCPMEPEDRDQFQDEDGCPEPGPQAAVVTVTDTRILISERIYFDFDTDTIRSVSLPLLDQVAAVIADIPSGRKIRVEGYSDSEGIDQYNLDLSYRRARAVVEYLSGRGVPRERLEYVGYGEANPVAPNDSPEGRALNRRVEFTILEPSDRARPTPPRRR